MPQHLTADPERRARFAREARLLATLKHPNIGAIDPEALAAAHQAKRRRLKKERERSGASGEERAERSELVGVQGTPTIQVICGRKDSEKPFPANPGSYRPVRLGP